MLSILKRTQTKEPFCFFVFTMDVTRVKPEYRPISDKMIAFLDGAAKEYNPENKVIKKDVTDIYEREFANCPNEQCYCSPYTLLRLFADMVEDIIPIPFGMHPPEMEGAEEDLRRIAWQTAHDIYGDP